MIEVPLWTYKASVQTILYFNGMLKSAAGEAFKSGILNAHKKHLRSREFRIVSVDFHYNEKASPRDMSRLVHEHNASGVILSGSEKNTSEAFDPWVRDYITGLRALLNLTTSIDSDWMGPTIPIFGICFGHQALAVALGGETCRFAHRSGFVEITARRQALNNSVLAKVLDGNEPPLKVGVTHGDHVVRIPKGMHLLATSDYCDCQAMAHDQWPILSVQCHPEITAEIQQIPGEEKWKLEKPEAFQTQIGPKILESVFDWMLLKALTR